METDLMILLPFEYQQLDPHLHPHPSLAREEKLNNSSNLASPLYRLALVLFLFHQMKFRIN